MADEIRSGIPAIVHAVDVGDWNGRQFFLRDSLQAADIDAVHLADRRVVADAEDPDAAMLAEVVVISLRTKYVAGEFTFAGDQPEAVRCGNCGPEPVAPADRAIAAITRLLEVQAGLNLDLSAVASCPVIP